MVLPPSEAKNTALYTVDDSLVNEISVTPVEAISVSSKFVVPSLVVRVKNSVSSLIVASFAICVPAPFSAEIVSVGEI